MCIRDRDVAVPPRLLARWDSLLLSHGSRHRTRFIDDEHRPAVFTRNADVLPTFLVDGFVAGTWDLSRTGAGTHLRLRPFGRLDPSVADDLAAETHRILGLVAPEAADRSVTFD